MTSAYEEHMREHEELREQICVTSRKLWARVYFRAFGHWPQKVVEERLQHADLLKARRQHARALHELESRLNDDFAERNPMSTEITLEITDEMIEQAYNAGLLDSDGTWHPDTLQVAFKAAFAKPSEPATYRLWVNDERTVLFRLRADGTAEIAIRGNSTQTWDAPIRMSEER